MDHFYAFLIFAVLLVLEQMARAAWLPLYYRLGIPVSLNRMRLAGANPPGGPCAGLVPPGALEKDLQEQFKSSPQYPSIRFKILGSRPADAEPQNPLFIAFHETPFEARRGFRYLPVMHSRVRIDNRRGLVTVTGFLDWYVVFILVYIALNALDDRSFIPVAALVLFVLGLSYLGQSAVNRQVIERLGASLANESAKE